MFLRSLRTRHKVKKSRARESLSGSRTSSWAAGGKQSRWSGASRFILFAGVVFLAGISFFAILSPSTVKAWFFFIAQNGMRQQWVFGSGCNSSSRPITVTYDSDDPSNGDIIYGNLIKSVHDEWNQDSGANVNILTDITTNGANITYFTMDVSAVNSFLRNPTPGIIRVVYDDNGSVLQSLGIDPDSGVLGIGVPLAIDSSRPNEICSGLMILNGKSFNSMTAANKEKYYHYTLLHELGHVLGFAHSVAGNNLDSSGVEATTGFIPVMHPFAPSPSQLSTPKTLTDDEKAGLITVYGQ